jgi:hypothetical protein
LVRVFSARNNIKNLLNKFTRGKYLDSLPLKISSQTLADQPLSAESFAIRHIAGKSGILSNA